MGFNTAVDPLVLEVISIEWWLMVLSWSVRNCPPLAVKSLFTAVIFASHRLGCSLYFTPDWVTSAVLLPSIEDAAIACPHLRFLCLCRSSASLHLSLLSLFRADLDTSASILAQNLKPLEAIRPMHCARQQAVGKKQGWHKRQKGRRGLGKRGKGGLRRQWILKEESWGRESEQGKADETGREGWEEKSRKVCYGCWFLPAGGERNHGYQAKKWCHCLLKVLGRVGVFWGGWQSKSVLHPQQFNVVHQENTGDRPVNEFVCLGFHVSLADHKRCGLAQHLPHYVQFPLKRPCLNCLLIISLGLDWLDW